MDTFEDFISNISRKEILTEDDIIVLVKAVHIMYKGLGNLVDESYKTTSAPGTAYNTLLDLDDMVEEEGLGG